MSSLPASMKRIRSKTAEKTWWFCFSYYKSMGIFSDAQGQPTPYSVVRSGRNSNSSKILCMSSLPTSLKRIGSIATEKKWWRRLFRRSRAANSIVSSGIWPKFKLIQTFFACPHYLQIWKRSDQKQPRKCDDVVFPIIMGIFSDAQGQLTPLSVVGSGRISNSCKLLCMS